MYIDVKKFIEWQKRREETNHDMSWDTIMDCLLDDYAQADAVPVVRCKDCIWQDECAITEFWGNGDGYCASGERKDNV